MKKFSYLLLFVLGFSTLFFACTKEEIDARVFVQQKIIGTWPLKYRIQSIYHDEILKQRDTLNAGLQVDTLVFDANGTVVRRYRTILATDTYSIDETATNITFVGPPEVTQKISFVRQNSLGFSTEDTIDSATVKIRTVTEDQLIKTN
ncbi:MAG: hypothetical protein EOO47_17880 [Flavobacterium sp.]|nr:MAG: hypothetical protein EOO47_17880 [Flavobacterium sp.]